MKELDTKAGNIIAEDVEISGEILRKLSTHS